MIQFTKAIDFRKAKAWVGGVEAEPCIILEQVTLLLLQAADEGFREHDIMLTDARAGKDHLISYRPTCGAILACLVV